MNKIVVFLSKDIMLVSVFLRVFLMNAEPVFFRNDRIVLLVVEETGNS